MISQVPSGPAGTGSAQLDDDRKARLLRMSAELWRDAMNAPAGVSAELRIAALVRAERWRKEAEALP